MSAGVRLARQRGNARGTWSRFDRGVDRGHGGSRRGAASTRPGARECAQRASLHRRGSVATARWQPGARHRRPDRGRVCEPQSGAPGRHETDRADAARCARHAGARGRLRVARDGRRDRAAAPAGVGGPVTPARHRSRARATGGGDSATGAGTGLCRVGRVRQPTDARAPPVLLHVSRRSPDRFPERGGARARLAGVVVRAYAAERAGLSIHAQSLQRHFGCGLRRAWIEAGGAGGPPEGSGPEGGPGGADGERARSPRGPRRARPATPPARHPRVRPAGFCERRPECPWGWRKSRAGR